MEKFSIVLKRLGPGLLFAGAAIGVSHLVQSTKAGAEFGLGLIWALVIANLFKYPFFQFGPRYALACLLYTSPSPRDATLSRMPSSA